MNPDTQMNGNVRDGFKLARSLYVKAHGVDLNVSQGAIEFCRVLPLPQALVDIWVAPCCVALVHGLHHG